jgi:Domain of unknown function (DUF1906)
VAHDEVSLMFKQTWVQSIVRLFLAGCLSCSSATQGHANAPVTEKAVGGGYLGLDRNLYPGDQTLPTIAKRFSFIGYWLNSPPGTQSNTWTGKRPLLRSYNLGFLVLWNGRSDQEILEKAKGGTSATALGVADAHAAIQAAKREGFPAGATLFIDQEEGGRLLQEQADYLFAWTEGVSAGGFHGGAYVSGVPAPDGPGKTITTAQSIKDTVTAKHLHSVALFVYQDSCPPSNGCTLAPPPLTASGTQGAIVWQFSQSPRETPRTQACMKTYASDGNCYVPELPGVYLDLDVASERDPSHGR